MIRVENQSFDGESVCMDGQHFVDCSLTNCILEYSGESFTLERTQLRGCRYVFFGSARATVHFLQSVGLMYTNPAEWCEVGERVQ